MGVVIDSISFQNEFRNETTDWLLGNICNKLIATIDIDVNNYASGNTSLPLYFHNITLNFINKQETIYSGNNPAFKDFKTGDIITITGAGSNNRTGVTIKKEADNLIRVVGENFTTSTATAVFIVVTNPITALNFFHNLIENAEGVNYNSKIDGSVQKMSVDSIDATDTATVKNFVFEGNKSWQIGSCTIKGLGGIDVATGKYGQKFRITHTFFVLPYYRAGEFEDNIKTLIAPELYADINSLKYAFKIEGLYAASNPNRKHLLEISDALGNVGWFNENFNNIPTKYTVQSITHRRPDLTILDSVTNNTTENTFEIVVKNTTASPFSSLNTKFVVGFSLCPDEDEYKVTSKNIIENFVFDRCIITLNGATANGDNYGTDQQVLKDVSATFVSSSEIKINGKIAFNSNLVAKISALTGQRYIMFVCTQNHTLDTDSADLVTLKADANKISIPLSQDGLITYDTVFVKHYDTTLTAGESLIEAFPGDEVILKSIMKYDLTGRDGDKINFKKLNIDLIVEKTGGVFTLESFEYDFGADQKVNKVTWVDYENNRVFVLPIDDARRLISLKRKTTLDSGNFYYYEILYPFLFRWEYWEALSGVDNAFFDNTEQNNGKNHFWDNYDVVSPWQIKARLRLTVDNNGTSAVYEDKRQISSNNYNSNANWINEYIKAYTIADVELTAGGNKLIQGFANTKIKAFFQKNAAFVPGDISVVIWAEVKEAGGIAGRTRISSVYDVQSESWFKSVDATPRVKLTFGGGNTTVLAEALIDYTKLPNAKDLRVYARLYEKPESTVGGKLTEADVLKTTEADVIKTIE